MSAVLEVPEDEDDGKTNQHSRHPGITYRRARDVGRGGPWTTHHPPSKSTSSVDTIPNRYQTVSIPSTSYIDSQPGTSSRGTTPYTSMTLPRASTLPPAHSTYCASASPKNNPLLNGGAGILQRLKVEDMQRIDLSRSGLASTTMATIEVVKGAAEACNRSGGLTRSLSLKLGRSKSRGKNGRTPSHLALEMPSALGFCSRISPPTSVPSHHVLVQVWAVGLDSRDAAIVLKDKQNTPGFIPGRSFVGRVVSVGWEVRDVLVRKGEWVVGLMEVKKVPCALLSI